jgi:hypothetical protein
VSRSRYLFSLVLTGLIAFELTIGLYLLYRTVRRSLYASNAEIIRPAHFIDTSAAFFLFMGATAVTVIVQGMVEGRIATPGWLRKPVLSDRALRRRAKLFNERVKLAANGLNAIGASSFLALFLTPILTQSPNGASLWLSGLAVAAICHGFAQLVMGLWKPED